MWLIKTLVRIVLFRLITRGVALLLFLTVLGGGILLLSGRSSEVMPIVKTLTGSLNLKWPVELMRGFQ